LLQNIKSKIFLQDIEKVRLKLVLVLFFLLILNIPLNFSFNVIIVYFNNILHHLLRISSCFFIFSFLYLVFWLGLVFSITLEDVIDLLWVKFIVVVAAAGKQRELGLNAWINLTLAKSGSSWFKVFFELVSYFLI